MTWVRGPPAPMDSIVVFFYTKLLDYWEISRTNYMTAAQEKIKAIMNDALSKESLRIELWKRINWAPNPSKPVGLTDLFKDIIEKYNMASTLLSGKRQT